MFPWLYGQQQKKAATPREKLLEWLSEGVPPELACRATGFTWGDELKADPEVDRALATGEIMLFERARDSGVTGTIRAAMRRETNSWTPKAEATLGLTIEDLLRDA